MVDNIVRKTKEQVLTPVAYTLQSVNPHWVTVMATILGVAAAIAGWQQAYALGLGLWLLSRLADGLDGTLARIRNQQTDLGSYLDILSDTLIWAIVPFGLALGQPTPLIFVGLVLLLIGIYLNSASWMYLAALLEKRQQGALANGEMTTVTIPTGLMEGTETVLMYSAFFIFPNLLFPLFMLMAGLALLTVLIRLVWVVRHL